MARFLRVGAFPSRFIYIIFTPAARLFTPFIRARRYSLVSTTKEVRMDLMYLTLAVILAALTVGMAVAISRTTGSN